MILTLSVPAAGLVVLDKLCQVAVHQQQSLSELRPLVVAGAEERQDMQHLEGVGHWGLQDREEAGHLDLEAGLVEVARAAAEGPQLPVVGAEEADLWSIMINRK